MGLSGHALRWLSAAVAVPVGLWIVGWAPAVLFYVLVGLVGAALWWESSGLLLGRNRPVLIGLGFLGWALTLAAGVFFGLPGLASGWAVGLILGGLYFLTQYRDGDDLGGLVGRYALAWMYAVLFLSLILPLYQLDQGRRWVLFVLAVTFAGDTFAFYAGRTWGRRKLWPSVSPKKTLEGLGGNVLGCALIGAAGGLWFLPSPWFGTALLGLFLGFWGPAGDLFESMLKRGSGIKDSGRLLPGHGGLLDRFDAVLFNLPIVYFYAGLFSGGSTG